MQNSEKYLACLDEQLAACRPPMRADSQEEGLGGGQGPVPADELGGGDVGAGDAEGDELAGEQGEGEAARPEAREAPPDAGCECAGGYELYRGTGNGLGCIGLELGFGFVGVLAGY